MQRHSSSGFTLVEMAVVLVIAGMLVTIGFSTVGILLEQTRRSSDRQVIEEGKEALFGELLAGGGLPAPRAIDGDNRALLHEDGGETDPGVPGALPADTLGVSATGSGSALLGYDVHPALRAEEAFSIADWVEWIEVDGGDQGELDGADTGIGTGGSEAQLCRNLNTLLALAEQEGDSLENDEEEVEATLPRVWSRGYVEDEGGDPDNKEAALENASPYAFVVLRRPEEAQGERLDRENSFDLDEKVYRVWENPNTPAEPGRSDAALRYDGHVAGYPLSRLAGELRRAGLCSSGPARCRNNEVLVTLINDTHMGVTPGWKMTGYLISEGKMDDDGSCDIEGTDEGDELNNLDDCDYHTRLTIPPSERSRSACLPAYGEAGPSDSDEGPYHLVITLEDNTGAADDFLVAKAPLAEIDGDSPEAWLAPSILGSSGSAEAEIFFQANKPDKYLQSRAEPVGGKEECGDYLDEGNCEKEHGKGASWKDSEGNELDWTGSNES
ncbi:type II secretion system protein [Halorhodospira neutriphila]|uniref:Prepilin-type N-terminal cleavage/methylation domain-containing protein n=1 Tax=Halorhodospira neutriphila TaxID=168379 RepID=A0ABS1E4C5_9GAMM|nr:prepilin-type N-terminal cleavage/methylation domain-containing protein [Halorhodospira neutriphila]MBK1725818.1 hypothetical protein [Halorhodospira neutriphila]